MTNRLPYAAKVLTATAKALRPSAKAETVGDPDGLGVYRTIKFDKRASTWLAPLLDELADRRIAESRMTEAGYLHVTFVPDRRADDLDPFPLASAEYVLKEKRR